jgi:hypothetical protein
VKFLKNFKLFETPDSVVIDGVEICKYNKDNNNFAFGYIDGKMLIGNTHEEISNDLNVDEQNRDYFLYSGRIWLNEKVISFWDYPKDNNALKKVIIDLEKKLNQLSEYKYLIIWNDTDFKIEILEEGEFIDYRGLKRYTKESLIPLKDYKGSEELSDEEKSIEHIDTTYKHKVPYGFGSKNPKYLDKRKWQHANIAQENNAYADTNEINTKPEIFSHTIYRLPTIDELNELNFHNLSSNEIYNGFCYTIIGKGILSNDNKQMIIDSIKMLCNLFPDNTNYKEALLKAENIKGKYIK